MPVLEVRSRVELPDSASASQFAERDQDEHWLRQSIALARRGMEVGDGGPFGAVIVRAGELLAEGWNRVLATPDPTAHAEVEAIRAAARALGNFSLQGCTLYASCEPCPMCLAAAMWARVDRIAFASTREDAAAAGFDDANFYQQLALELNHRALPMQQFELREGGELLRAWSQWSARRPY